MLLFRYSALTFNGHRIHYDRSYCERAEGYPGLVVHGPLTATLLMDLYLRQRPVPRCAPSASGRGARCWTSTPSPSAARSRRAARICGHSTEGFMAMTAQLEAG